MSVMKVTTLSWLLMAFVAGCASQAPKATASITAKDKGSFTNPILPNGADPWLEYFDGNYYLTTTTWTSQLVMRKSPTLAGLKDAKPVYLWSETNPSRCCNFWAFEFHRLKTAAGYRWFLMFTSGKQENYDGQHLSVLESAGDDPMGPYSYKGSPMPNSWNIDGTYLQHQGSLYLLWSQWVGDEQRNFIAKMKNPWTIEGPKVVLTRPIQPWAQSGRKVNEGPEVLKHNGRTFVIYSASFCDTPDYKLAQIELTGDNPLDAKSWTYAKAPVFTKGNGVYGPGHNGFFMSPDGKQNWLVYHANSKSTQGCGLTRSLRAQPFSWHKDGSPDFGEPASEATVIKAPSGENGPLKVVPQGAHWQLTLDGQPLAGSNSWVIDPTLNGYYRLANSQGEFLTATSCGKSLQPWQNQACQQWQLSTDAKGHLSLQSQAGGSSLGPVTALPLAPVALVSAQSGKVASLNHGQLIQSAFTHGGDQLWRFKAAADGFVTLAPETRQQCLAVKDKSLAAGAAVVMAGCGGPQSQWALHFKDDGSVQLINRHSQQSLDLASCGLADGTAINQAPATDSRCQHFLLRKP
ncbi:family 43 glycosylhydrolase [Gallaecimonas mangrovi]|uniref:family 43 glycosylhydrolase n=1 Tax=Gallaecimonas mangrovi TaxID=2291597 RepID=UPI000E20B5F6|nr:family 43 glycosylhydrolase [Gallaecimonas mangrovi]